MAGKRGRSGPPRNQNAVQHGLHHYKRLLSGDGLKRSTALYHALREKELELVSALGGDPSPQERAIIGDTIKTMLYIGSLDNYLMQLKSLVRKGRVHAVLAERTRLGSHLRENLKSLGLERRAKPIPDLQKYLEEKYGESGSDDLKGTLFPEAPRPSPSPPSKKRKSKSDSEKKQHKDA